MPCCGRRARVQPPSRPRISRKPPAARRIVAASQPSAPQPGGIAFRYVGKSALSFRGPVTGTQYRFAEPGAILAIHPHDAAYLRNHPRLRRASRSEHD